MSSSCQPAPACRRAHRVVACFLAGLVFALTVLAASPSLHARLHSLEPGHTHATDADHAANNHDDAGCGITLFGHGITTPLALPHLEAPRLPRLATLAPALNAPLLSAPRHLLQPARGPPAIG